ncbi:ATP-dependent DNA helicase [Shewanella cyperi]|uniref:ATP-dependent DNA helicase n=1 Tax=Shewanella cyperi TaxID=2814292 RepID=A0A974XQH2_9GAMM|nr:ATP-dependent DNA helicase [Shewanella cyperi]QSX31523.1 ATP-dependent DNA helicase [Shewanella cyperi]
MSLVERVHAVLGQGGLLASQLRHYRERAVQLEMAAEVAGCLTSSAQPLVLEAGTGVGKTFAYLVPALLSGKQIIISTGSKNLQEQLFFKDLPALLGLLGLDIQVALLKGRSNYLCQWRLARQLEAVGTHQEAVLDDLLKLQQFADNTTDGDLGNLSGVSESSPAIGMINSSRDSCGGQKCAFYEQCFTRKARQRALQARLIVVNHHLFFADRLLKDTGFAELLPDADAVVFDEAHLLPDIAVSYFGSQLSMGRIKRLLDEVDKVYQQQLRDTAQLTAMAGRCRERLSDWQNRLLDKGYNDWRDSLADKEMAAASWALVAELLALEKLVQAHLGRSEMLDVLAPSLTEVRAQLEQFFHCDNPEAAYSVEWGERHLQLRIAAMDVAHQCAELFNDNSRWVFTSATLQVQGSLDFFVRGMGLTKARQVVLSSPFDYPNQALLCVPRHLGHVANQTAMVKRLVDICLKAFTAARGRTFVLFTSHRMLQLVAHGLAGRTPYPMLVQGQGSKQQLLSKFRQLGDAVLLGTGSFWEGVDVRGHSLSCVIIDKLPFASPDDPLFRARAGQCQRQGLDPFTQVSLPQAVIALKQGAGRLIRDERDKGVLIICDNRLVNRDYGRAFLGSLPPMARTRDLDRALAFLADIP